MKKIIVLSLICLPLLSFSQTKEQLSEMLVEVLLLENWQDQFEQQVNEFGDVIIERRVNPGVPEFKGEAVFQELVSEDLDDSPFQVLILDSREIKNRGYNQRRLMTWLFDFRDDQILIMIGALQEDTKRMLRGQFIFQPNGEEWELVSQNTQEG